MFQLSNRLFEINKQYYKLMQSPKLEGTTLVGFPPHVTYVMLFIMIYQIYLLYVQILQIVNILIYLITKKKEDYCKNYNPNNYIISYN